MTDPNDKGFLNDPDLPGWMSELARAEAWEDEERYYNGDDEDTEE